MSSDQLASSFGEPNGQPPTPKRTPTFSILPSPVFETPKNNQGRFDESSRWTPRFAEEFSVFNTTPGSLRNGLDSFPAFSPATPSPVGAGQKRPLSTDETASETAEHVNKLPPNASLQLPRVESSKILRSSPVPLQTPTFGHSAAADQLPGPVERSAKKACRGPAALESQRQPVTPPPTARKGDRKLAPKLDTVTMQNDQDFVQQHYMATTPQQAMGSFVTAQGDMFAYPLSAPASAPAFGAQRSFWDSDPNLAGLNIDFGTGGGEVFQPHPSHQASGPAAWAAANQMLQSHNGVAGHGSGHASSGDHHSTLVSQGPMPMLVTSSAEHRMFAVSYPTPVDDPFGISDNGGAVNPGLLFSQPQSASMHQAPFSQSMQPPGPTAHQGGQLDGSVSSIPEAGNHSELRRSATVKDVTPKKQDRTSASSPTKSTGRPGLSRSFSENRGRKPLGRSSLPTLAPAPRPQSQLVNNAGVGAKRAVVSQPQRPSGRSSPSKSTHHKHQHRLSSLSSIPETSGPRMRTQAKFTIDANGRARVETTVVVVNEPSPTARKRHSSYTAPRRQWDSSSDDDSSSTDEDPIIIPSRNTSFALPDPRKPTTVHPFHSSRPSISERSTTSSTSFQGGLQNDEDSDGETVVDELTPTRKASGDAVSELRKLRESRQRQHTTSKHKRLTSSGSRAAASFGNYSGRCATSPTTLSDASLPTPTSDSSRNRGVRCVCNRTEAGRDEFLVQCESCEMWVHGQCVNITQREMPSIYICAICANTPNVRGGRVRDNGGLFGSIEPLATTTSPLAHKSLKSFR